MFYFALIILLLVILVIASMFLINKVPKVTTTASNRTKGYKKGKGNSDIEGIIEDIIDPELIESDEIFKDLPVNERIIFLAEQHSGYILEILKGHPLGKHLDLIGTKISLGRSPSSDITIDDQLISEKHAIIKIIPGKPVIIDDLTSTNGTYVNDESIISTKLQENDIIVLGETKLKLKKEFK